MSRRLFITASKHAVPQYVKQQLCPVHKMGIAPLHVLDVLGHLGPKASLLTLWVSQILFFSFF